jgi:hypothetical protein
MYYYMCIYVYRYMSCWVSDFRMNTVLSIVQNQWYSQHMLPTRSFLTLQKFDKYLSIIFLITIVGCMYYYMCIHVYRYMSCWVSDFRMNTVFTLWERWVLSTLIRKNVRWKTSWNCFPSYLIQDNKEYWFIRVRTHLNSCLACDFGYMWIGGVNMRGLFHAYSDFEFVF